MKTLAAIAIVLSILASSAQARVWKDQQGRPMSAKFVETYQKDGQTFVVFTKGEGMRYQVPLNRLSKADQAYITEIQANGGMDANQPAAATASEKTDFEKAITKHLVKLDDDGDGLKRVKGDDIASKDYYAIYYSAQWCPPCRGFTPKLVDFYNEYAAKNDNFELIFVSSDRNENDMERYITEYEMPWLSLDFDMKDRADELMQYKARGIPCLVLVDRNGNVIKHSYVGDQYVGPTSVMKEIERQLDQKKG